jgi:Ni,Fe-hydrogenase III small subunit
MNDWLRFIRDRIHLLLPWRRPPHALPLPGRARSVTIRHVDGGSNNAAELEAAALFNPVYDLERFGFHLAASPRHADLMLLSGPLTRNMQAAVEAAFQAMPEPRRVVTLGDGFGPHSALHGSYALVPLPEALLPAWIAHIPGDPPDPETIARVLLSLDLV